MSSDLALVLPNGRQLLCHKAVLAAGSKKLAAAFQQGNMGPVLPVQGVDSDALEAVVSSFYTGECPVTIQSVAAIYDAAIKLEVAGLVEACSNFVKVSLTADNCCTLLESALRFKVGPVTESCLEFLHNRFTDVTSSKDFLSRSFEIAAEILADAVQKQPALAVLKAAASWLGYERMREDLQHKLLEALGVPANCTLEDILRTSRSVDARQMGDQSHMHRSTTTSSVDDPAAAASLVANAARLATQMGPAAALQAANAMAATAVSLMNMPNLQGNLPILQVLPNGQLQTLQSNALLPGIANSIASSSAAQLPQIQALKLPANSPASLAAAFALPNANSNMGQQISEDTKVLGAGITTASISALSGLLSNKGGISIAVKQEGQQELGSWEPSDSMLALARVVAQDQQHADDYPSHGHSRKPGSSDRPQQAASIASNGRRRQERTASGTSSRSPTAAIAAMNHSKRKRYSSAAPVVLNAGLPADDENAPGKLYDATPATTIAVGVAHGQPPGAAAMGGGGGLSGAARMPGPANTVADSDVQGDAGLRKTMLGLVSGSADSSATLMAYRDKSLPTLGGKLGHLPAPPVVKGICHVDNCYSDLTNLKEYHLRYKICEYHLKSTSIMKDGIPQRFCQQCGRFHPLEAFDGTRRSCRAMLQRHNARRAKKSASDSVPVTNLSLPPGLGPLTGALAAAVAAHNNSPKPLPNGRNATISRK